MLAPRLRSGWWLELVPGCAAALPALPLAAEPVAVDDACATEGRERSNVAAVTITVAPRAGNTPPPAAADSHSTAEGTALVVGGSERELLRLGNVHVPRARRRPKARATATRRRPRIATATSLRLRRRGFRDRHDRARDVHGHVRRERLVRQRGRVCDAHRERAAATRGRGRRRRRARRAAQNGLPSMSCAPGSALKRSSQRATFGHLSVS